MSPFNRRRNLRDTHIQIGGVRKAVFYRTTILLFNLSLDDSDEAWLYPIPGVYL